MILVLLVNLLILIPGCWDNREIADQAIVTGIGVDKGTQDRLRITVQMIIPAAVGVGAQGGGDGAQKTVFVAWAEARTIHEALNLVAKQSNRVLLLSHKEIIVVSEELAREGIVPVIDWHIRARETRSKNWLVVTSATAQEVLELPPSGVANIPAFNIGDNIKLSFQHSKVPLARVFDFASAITGETKDPVAVALHLTKDKPPRPKISGSAVFRDFKLAGYLTETETRGYLWVTGDTKRGFISARLPGVNNKYIALQMRGSKIKVQPEFQNGIPVIKVNIDIKSALDETAELALKLDRPEVIDELEALMERQITMEVEAAVTKAQQLDADIFGFGDSIKRKHPAVWEDLKYDWEWIFPVLEVEVTVKSIIRRTGMLATPIRRPGS